MAYVEMRRVLCLLAVSLLVPCARARARARAGARARPDHVQYDTIIVGLGAAGAAAASRLAARGDSLLAVDAMQRVGGRICTRPLGDGLVEMGAEWMHGTQPSMVYDTAVAHNVTVLEQTFDMPVYTSRGPAGVNIKDLVDVASEYAFSHNGLPGVSIADYTTHKLIEYVEAKYPELSNSSVVSDVLRHVSLMVGGYEAADWQLVASHSSYRDLNGTQYASWGRAGYATYINILLNKQDNGPGYPNLDIKLGTEVQNIVYDGEGQDSVTVTTTNGTYTATNVIVTVSLGVLKQRHSSMFTPPPPLPADKVAAIEAIPMGLLGKIQLAYHTPWWTNIFPKKMSVGSDWLDNLYTRRSYSYEGLSVTASMRRTLGEPLADSSGTPRVYLAGEGGRDQRYMVLYGAWR